MAKLGIKNFHIEPHVKASSQEELVQGIGCSFGCLGLILFMGWLLASGLSLYGKYSWLMTVRGYGEIHRAIFIVGEIMALFGLGLLLRAIREAAATNKNPRRHAIYKQLERFGPLETSILAVEKEIQESGQPVDDLLFSPTYLLRQQPLSICKLTELAWIYRKVTSHSTNLIPTHKTYDVIIHTRDGQEWHVQGTAESVNDMFAHLETRCPWIAIGYSKELELMWKRSRKEFLLILDQKLAMMNQQST